uniref:Uncharacterized protein n=1 Tax=Anguilla anguilla TaxID=7936 RepID=A0A0E9PJQ4_ANGAN
MRTKDFYIGIILPCFQSSGISPVFKDCLKIPVSGLKMMIPEYSWVYAIRARCLIRL